MNNKKTLFSAEMRLLKENSHSEYFWFSLNRSTQWMATTGKDGGYIWHVYDPDNNTYTPQSHTYREEPALIKQVNPFYNPMNQGEP